MDNNNIIEIQNNSIIDINLPITNVNEKREFVTEGKATVKLSNEDNTFSAFYNPAQVYYKF